MGVIRVQPARMTDCAAQSVGAAWRAFDLQLGTHAALVLLQPELGISLVFGAILAGMLWMAGVSLRWLAVLAVGTVAMVPLAWNYLLRDYQKERLLQFMDSNPDIQGAGFQLHQAQIAVGSGGFVGKGLTNGTQTQGGFLPVQATDFVFATLAEELGFIGGGGAFFFLLPLLCVAPCARGVVDAPLGLTFSAGRPP